MSKFRLSNLNAKLHAGDVGTEIIVTVYDITEVDGELVQTVLDLAGFTVTMLLCYNDQTIEKATELVGLASAGTVKAVTADGDLIAGTVAIRLRLEITGSDEKWHTAAIEKRIHAVC